MSDGFCSDAPTAPREITSFLRPKLSTFQPQINGHLLIETNTAAKSGVEIPSDSPGATDGLSRATDGLSSLAIDNGGALSVQSMSSFQVNQGVVAWIAQEPRERGESIMFYQCQQIMITCPHSHFARSFQFQTR